MQQRSHRVSSEAEELVFKGDLSQVSLDHHPETQLSVEPGKSVKVSLVQRVSTSDEQPSVKRDHLSASGPSRLDFPFVLESFLDTS